MTEPTVRSIALNVAEAMLRVAPGRFFLVRCVLWMVGLCIVLAGMCWVIGAAAEFGFGVSIPGLAPQRDQSAPVSLLLVAVVAALYGGFFVFLCSVFDRTGVGHSVKHGDPSEGVAPAWWVTALLTGLAVSLGTIASGALYAADQWLFTSRNLFVANEISFITWFALFVGVCFGCAVAVLNGASRLARFAATTLIAPHWLLALTIAAQWLFVTTLLIVLCANFSVVARSVLLAFGFDAQITSAMVVAALLFNAFIASFGAGLMWVDRSRGVDGRQPPSSRQDFWDVDLGPETSRAGMASTGYPFYVWRESADSRLGLSRPRHCVIRDDGRDLNFTFFDPSKDRQRTWAVLVGVAVAVVVAFVLTFAAPVDRGSLSFFGTALMAVLLGVLAAVAWHLGLTLWRWNSGRFENDGRFTTKPLRLLSGFSKEHAGEIGAKIDGEKAKTGYGLAATFDDGSMIILTGNAWSFPSIVEHHSALTNAFRLPRDEYVAQWEAKQRASKAFDTPDAPDIVAGVPDRL